MNRYGVKTSFSVVCIKQWFQNDLPLDTRYTHVIKTYGARTKFDADHLIICYHKLNYCSIKFINTIFFQHQTTFSFRKFFVKVIFTIRYVNTKVGCAFPMAIWSELHLRQYRDGDHREDVPHVTVTKLIYGNSTLVPLLFDTQNQEVYYPLLWYHAVSKPVLRQTWI